MRFLNYLFLAFLIVNLQLPINAVCNSSESQKVQTNSKKDKEKNSKSFWQKKYNWIKEHPILTTGIVFLSGVGVLLSYKEQNKWKIEQTKSNLQEKYYFLVEEERSLFGIASLSKSLFELSKYFLDFKKTRQSPDVSFEDVQNVLDDEKTLNENLLKVKKVQSQIAEVLEKLKAYGVDETMLRQRIHVPNNIQADLNRI